MHSRPIPAPSPEPAALTSRLRRRRAESDTGSFLRMVSHELRTPLNAVIGFSELIARELHGPIGDPRYAEHARLIRQSGLTLLSLVNQVMDLARLEQDAMELTLRPEALEEVVAEALDDARPAADARSVRLACLLDADADRVVCDRRGLRIHEHVADTYQLPGIEPEAQVRLARVQQAQQTQRRLSVVGEDAGVGLEDHRGSSRSADRAPASGRAHVRH